MNPSHRGTTPPWTPSTGGHRADIDGLRALAVLLVVSYHVWFGRVSGGVDVFLMLSAYLLTLSLVGRARRGEPLGLVRHWRHRFARLLPAAVMTLVAVLALTHLALPAEDWPRIWDETWASLFYVQNWSLAAHEVDYYARDLSTASPLQHFWSLSVQGQVFILWPLLIAATVWLVRRRPERLLAALVAEFTIVFVASLAFSVVTTSTAQEFAYFDTRTRLWEFAAGSLAALLIPFVRWPAVVRTAMGWIGVAGILACGFVLDVEGSFPGYVALWPVLCTAMVIASGDRPTRGGVARLLSVRPLQAVGRHSYALYLVHWPILVAWGVLLDRPEVGLLGGVLVVFLSILAARALSTDVERPVRRFAAAVPARRETMVLAASVLLVAGPLVAWQVTEDRRAAAIAEESSWAYPGAAAIDADDTLLAAPLLPAPTAVTDEWVVVGDPCGPDRRPQHPAIADRCHERIITEGPDVNVLVIGDSHAQQMSEPLLAVARERNWSLTFLLMGGCALGFGEIAVTSEGPEACEEWRRAAVDYALDQRPDAVYLMTTKAVVDGPERIVTGLDAVVAELLDAGVGVIGVRDNPRFSFNMYECVANGLRGCDVPLEHVLSPLHPALDLDERVLQVDFTPWLCPAARCLGAIGNIAVYLDDNHLTSAYARTLAPMLGDMVDADSWRFITAE